MKSTFSVKIPEMIQEIAEMIKKQRAFRPLFYVIVAVQALAMNSS